MSVITSAVLTYQYLKEVDNNGTPVLSVEIAEVRKMFDSYNEAALYLVNSFIPNWNENLNGTLPTVFEVRIVSDKVNFVTSSILIEVVNGTASQYTLP